MVLSRRISILLAACGLLIASYLTWAHYTVSQVFCIDSSGCEIVQQSRYAMIGSIPVALLGMAGYMAILGALALEEAKGPLAESSPFLIFAATLVGALYSIYLTYLELFVIYAICQYCVASAIIMFALFGLAIYRLKLKEVF